MAQPVIGFIGIGAMGWPMAARLCGAGFRVIVSDTDARRAADFALQHQAQAAPADARLASACHVLITMLPNSAVVEQVLLGAGGLAEGLRPGTLVLEMSSGVPAATIRLAQRLDAAGVQLVDAPVSGGVPRARTGELAIMAGGTERDLERAAPILSAMGNRILRTGAVGSAHAMKALNNMVSAAGFLAAAEALLVGSRFGLDPGVIVDVLNASTGMNNSTQKKLRQFVLSGSFDSGFGLDLMLKDLGIARDLAGDTGAAAPLSSACHQLWQAARNILGPGHDHTEMARVSQLLAGATVLPARA